MKSVFFFISLIFSSSCFAATRLQFFIGDRNAMALITPADSSGNSDSDSSDLYQVMNVPEQDTMLGKGKSIISVDRDFNLICGEYRNQCQVILNRSPHVLISGLKKQMSFIITGDAAARLTEQFKLNSKGEAYFMTTDKLFRLSGSASTFIFEATEN